MKPERRHFERLEISSEALALDETGRELGLVTQASGGGLGITLHADVPRTSFREGELLRITVVEPHTDIRNTFTAEVRYVAGDLLGLEFVGTKKAGA